MLREGLTNVVRHAHATSCAVRLSPSSVEIIDDGVGGAPLADDGLAGLRQRATAAGGLVDAGPRPAKWLAVAGLARPRGRGAGVIRLLLADDQELVRTALAALLELEEDFEVVATVGRGDEVVAAARSHHPDVALLDIEMPGIDGLAAAAVLAQEVPECRSLILTTFGRPGYLRRAMESGARRFVVKDAPAEQLSDAIRRVVAGERVVDPVLAAATLAHGASPLTPRERDVWWRRSGAARPISPPSCSCRRARCVTTFRPP